MALLNFKFLSRLSTPAPVNSVIASGDRVDTALNKLQGQINALSSTGTFVDGGTPTSPNYTATNFNVDFGSIT